MNINRGNLTDKQIKFCYEYVKDLDVRTSYRAAYPNCKQDSTAYVNGSKLLKKANIQNKLSDLQIDAIERTKITQDDIILSLKEVVYRCMQKIPVMIRNGKGDLVESGIWKFDAAGANKALELLGRHLGMFVDKVQMEGSFTFEDFILDRKKRMLDNRN